MFDYTECRRLTEATARDSERGWPTCKTDLLAIGSGARGACRCRTIVDVKSEDVSFTPLVMSG